MLVGGISHHMKMRGAGQTVGAPKQRIEAYTGRKELSLKPVEKKRKTGFIGGLKSAFSKFGSWVKSLVMPKASKKVKETSFTSKFNRINQKLEELNDELQGVDRDDIRSKFDTIHARLATLEAQVGLYDAVADHELPRAFPVAPPRYHEPIYATEVSPMSMASAPPMQSLYSVSGTHKDVTQASQTVSSTLAPHTRDLMKDMSKVAEVVDARKNAKESPRQIQEAKLRDTLASDPALAKRFYDDAVLSADDKKAIALIREMTQKAVGLSRQVSDVADVVFDVNRDVHLQQFQARLNMIKGDPNRPDRADYESIQADIKSLTADIDTIRNWVSSYQEVLAEMQRLFAEFGPYLSAEKESIQIEIDTLMRKQQLFYSRLSHAELSLQGSGYAVAIPM